MEPVCSFPPTSARAFVDVAQAASLLGVSPATVRRLCRTGVLPAVRGKREWQVELEGLRSLRTCLPALSGDASFEKRMPQQRLTGVKSSGSSCVRFEDG